MYLSHAGFSFEIFFNNTTKEKEGIVDDSGIALPPGYYWWYCQPGCLPDSDPFGPFKKYYDAENDIYDSHPEKA